MALLATSTGAIDWIIAGVALVVVLLLGRTRWSRNLARERGLQGERGQPTRQALWTAAGIAVIGVVLALATQNWTWLAAVGVGGAIGAARYVAYRSTGTWR